MPVFQVSAKNGQGMNDYLSFLEKSLRNSREAAIV
jgi:hypothetical protein